MTPQQYGEMSSVDASKGVQEPPSAFVLMPFDAAFAPIYEELIKPALEEVGYAVTRADSQLTQQNILRDVVAGIANATLVVADLTTLNPNVMYELGLCHGLQVPTVLIAQTIEDLPFDLRSYRVVRYSEQFTEAPKLIDALRELGTRRREGRSAFGSPVLDFLGSQPQPSITGAELPRTPPEAPTLDEEVSKGFLDFLVASQDETERLTHLLNQINGEMTRLSARIEQRAEELERAGATGPKVAMAILVHAANDMTEFSDEVDAVLPEYIALTDALSEDLSAYVAQIRITSDDEATSAGELRDTYASQRSTIGETLSVIGEFREAVDNLPPVSRATNAGKRRVVASLDKLIGALEKHEALSARIVNLVDVEIERWKSAGAGEAAAS